MRKFVVIPYDRFMAQKHGDKPSPLMNTQTHNLDNKITAVPRRARSTSGKLKDAPINSQLGSIGRRRRRKTALPPHPPTLIIDAAGSTKVAAPKWISF